MQVDWPSKTKVNILKEGLESLGKMLCRGTYSQIANAVWKHPTLKKHKFDEELKTKAPQLSAVLKTASLRKSKREKRDAFWLPSVCMSAAVLLKNRSPYMNLLQLMNTSSSSTTLYLKHGEIISIYKVTKAIKNIYKIFINK